MPSPSIPHSSSSISRPSPSICQICEEKASGHHYQVISCIGCKSFFRRAAVLGRVYRCKRGAGGCTPNQGLRRCKACRFQKCLTVGMNPLLLEPQNAAEARNAETLAACNGNVHHPITIAEDRAQLAIDDLMHANEAFERLRMSTYDPHPIYECNESLVLEGPSKLGFYYEHLPACSSQLVIADLESMKQFLRLLNHTKFCGASGSVKHWTTTGFVCAAELMKILPRVDEMSRDERRHLLISSSLAVSHFSDSFFSYQHSSPFTTYPDGSMPYGADPPYALASEFHTAVIQKIGNIGMDRVEFLLARAILCYSASASDPSIEKSRQLYTKVLCSYTIASRGTFKGPSTVLEILSLISYVISLTQRMKDFQQLLGATRRPAMRSPLIEAVMAS